MVSTDNAWRKKLRTLLVLGRVSNLPTVWSNCLAGWLLGGGDGPLSRLLLVCAGTTLLYVGGMYLNDAFDAEFDRQHRRERPIPTGAISEAKVWILGFSWLGLGTLALAFLGLTTAILTFALVACILLYDAVHKALTFSPVIMAGCRFLLYLIAASAAASGVTGLAIWSALVLAAYVVGLSYLARQESTGGFLSYWPCVLLGAPIVLALIVNDAGYAILGIVLCLVLTAWILHCLRPAFWDAQKNIGRAVSGFLAGIVLVDLLAVAGGSLLTTALFVLLFVAALLFQRFIPAT